MNTVVSTLSVTKALESSLSFSTEFIKKYWLLVILYIAIVALPGFVLGDQNVAEMTPGRGIQLAATGLIVGLGASFISLFMAYYGISMAVSKLDASAKVFSKGLPKSLWQIFCTHFLVGLIAVPLLILFIVPGVWWLTKASVSCARLLSTDDGPIESLRKSHELMNNRFWQCFGFLFASGFIISIIILLITGSVGLCLFVGGMFHSAFSADSDIHKMANIFRIVSGVISVFGTIIFYYLQAWLYVYLKDNPIVQSTP